MTKALVGIGALLVLCFTTLGLMIYLTRTEDRIAVDNLLAEDLWRAIGTAQADNGGRVELTRVEEMGTPDVLGGQPTEPGEPNDIGFNLIVAC